MRKLNDTEKQQLAQHKLWLASNGKEGARLDWSWANLREANLRGADLNGADLRGADLSGADLSGADLSWSALLMADLRGADMSGADLHDADLSGADLRGADLSGAELSGSALFMANLRGANLSKANGYIGFENVGSEGRTLHCTLHDDGWHFFTGCFGAEGNNLEAFVAAVKQKHANRALAVQYLAIVEYLQKMEPFYRKGEL